MTARYWKGREVLKEYKQGRLVYEKQSSIPDYLCFTALEAGQFTLTIPAAVTPTYLSYVEWSKDGRTWNHTDNTSEAVTIDVQVTQGDKVYWRGSGVSTGSSESKVSGHHTNFSATADFNVSGNIMSLLYPTNFEVTSFPNGSLGFCNLFKGNSHLISAEDLSLSVTTPVSYCFFGLFLNCTGLIKAPSIPLTTFSNTSMVCRSMFSGCTSLVKAPDLPVAVPASQSYYQMFYGCTSLNYVKCLATDISATNCLSSWLNGVSATGTFIQASGVTWPRGGSGIPTGWLAYDEGDDIPNDYTPCDYIHANKGSGLATGIYADKSTYGCELEYNFTQDEIDSAISGTKQWGIFYYNKADKTDPDFPKQTYGYLYCRANTGNLAWQANRGIYTNPTTGEKSNNSSQLVITKAIAGWHHIRCAANTEDTNFECTFDASITKYVGTTYYQIMNENPTDTPAEILIWGGNTGHPVEGTLGDLKYLKIIHPDGETIVAHYVPCTRNSDGVAGFWDLINKTFRTSTGTAQFTAGYLTP